MRRPSKSALRLVRALVGGAEAWREGEVFRLAGAGGRIELPAPEVRELVSQGVLDGDAAHCRSNAGTAQWLKRQMIEADAFAAQHRLEAPGPEGSVLDLADSPLARLAAADASGEAFLKPHQVQAGERLRRLFERARLQPRVTMSYSPAHTAGGKDGGHAAEIGDMAADARRELAGLYRQLPRDCAGVAWDVCGFGKGLQQVEGERGWPRRSAKLVLRIALDRLAEIHGLGEAATGAPSRRQRAWMDGARVAMFD